jgi:peroxiredoxin
MSKTVQVNAKAPAFELDDFDADIVNLSDFRRQKRVVLVFNRSFA